MMMCFETVEGRSFIGETYKEVVLRMAQQDFLVNDKGAYMDEVKRRLAIFNIHIPRIHQEDPDKFEKFIKALLRNRLLREVAWQ